MIYIKISFPSSVFFFFFFFFLHLSTNFLQTLYKSSNQEVKMGKFDQCIQSYEPSFMTKFCSALYLENLLTNIFAKLNLRGGVSCLQRFYLEFLYQLHTVL